MKKFKIKLCPLILLAPLIVVGSLAWSVEASKIDCFPLEGASREKCESLGCIWSPVQKSPQTTNGLPFNRLDEAVQRISGGLNVGSNIREPWCYMPENYANYIVSEDSHTRMTLKKVKSSGLENDVEELTVQLIQIDKTMMRVKIFDSKNKRFEAELPEFNIKKDSEDLENSIDGSSEFKIVRGKQNENGEYDPNLVIVRKDTNAPIFSTDLSKLIYSDQFIQLNNRLDSPYLFGLGEHYDKFVKRTDQGYKSYSFFNTDKLPLPDGRRSYGGFPFYISFDSKNMANAHGVYLHNSDAMDVILQPDQSITFRPIGGILDFVLFLGPTPNDVIKQYQSLTGLPILPPRWSLGFHLCRYDYKTLETTKKVWKRTVDSGIPFDVQWNDIDNMDRHNDFTYDHKRFAGLPEFIDELHSKNMHYMILFDPGLSQEDNYYPYTLGKEMDIFVKNATNQTLVGKVWNDSGRTVFPDFSNKKSHDYWSKLFVKFQQEIKFDGAWIDMNDISSFVYGSLDGCPKDNYEERAPYKPGGYDLQTNTLCLSARHQAGSEYDLHNLYSFYEAIATKKALEASRPNKRPFVLSRSTSPGQNAFSGHWSGDVLSNWDYLRWSIPSLIEHSMYGFSVMGSDICGFTGNSNKELCARWSTLGAFYTFSRNHNDDVSIDQDPVAMGPEVVEANRNALTKKYSLLPYLYTLIHKASKFGEPVVKSVPLEYYAMDKEALNVEYQFLWGDGLMISPVVEPNTSTKQTYLPKGRWYETNVLPTKEGEVKVPLWIDSEGGWHETTNIGLEDIPLFYKGGHILPFYTKVLQTTTETARQPIGFEVILCPKNKAHGELYLDDGDNVDGKLTHLTMTFENNKLTITQIQDDYEQEVKLGAVKIYGISSNINAVKVDDRTISFKRAEHVIIFELEGVSISKNHSSVVVELD